jgi:hypothetical protein
MALQFGSVVFSFYLCQRIKHQELFKIANAYDEVH